MSVSVGTLTATLELTDNASAKLTQFGGSLDTATTKLAASGASVGTLGTQYDALGKHTDVLSTKLRDASGRFVATGKDSDGLGTKFDGLSGKSKLAGLSIGSLASNIGAIGAGLLAGGAIAAIGSHLLQMASDVMETADALTKMSDKTGIGVEALGRLQAVADASGNTLEQITGAVNRMQKALAGGDTSAAAAVKEMGLSLSALMNMRPEAQFTAIAGAIAKIQDPAKQTQLAMELFGRAGAEILPTIKSDITAIGDAAVVMSAQTVKNIDEMGDAWQAFKRNVTAAAGNVFGYILEQNREANLEADRTIARLKDVHHLLERLPDFSKMSATKAPVNLPLAVPGLPSSEMMDYLDSQMVRLTKRNTEVTQATHGHTDALTKLRGQLSGSDLLTKAQQYEAVVSKIGGASTLTSKETADLAGTFRDVVAKYQQLGTVGTKTVIHYQELLRALTPIPPVIREVTADLSALGTRVPLAKPTLDLIAMGNSVEYLQRHGLFAEATLKELGTTIGTLPARTTTAAESFRHLGTEGGNKFVEALQGSLSRIPDTFRQAFTGGGGVLGALKSILIDLGQSIGSLISQRISAAIVGSTRNLSVGKVEGGGSGLGGQAISSGGSVAAGAATAGMTAGSIGAAAATAGVTMGISLAVVGAIALYKAKHLAEWEKLGKDIGRDFGVSLNQAALKEMEKDAKRYGRQAAGILNLDTIIEGGGGLNGGNLEKFTAKLRDTFALVQTGALTAAQATHILDENWQQFAEAGTSASGRISTSLKEIILLNDRMGTQSKEIAAWQLGQGTTAVNAFTTTMKGAALTSSQALSDMGLQAVASITAAVASGMSLSDALHAAAPGLQQLTAGYAALGLDIDNAAIRSLMFQSTILEGNPDLMAALGGLSQQMIALDNLGVLNVETFGAMERTGVAMYARLQAATAAVGGTTSDALGPMQQWLHDAAEQAALLGVPLDDNTTMLIEQSRELGIWRDKGQDATSKLTDGMQTLVDKVGELIDRLTHIPDVDFNINGHYNAPNQTPVVLETPEFRYGTGGQLVDFSPRGTLVTLHGEERVQTKAEVLANERRREIDLTPMLAELRRGNSWQRTGLPDVIRRAVRDETQKAARR